MTVEAIPLVSVVIPSYNHERYIGKAVQSVLASSVEQLEVIVVDDGSADDSVQIVKSIQDPRIRVLEQTNKGAHAAINRGVEMAAGEWVAILNSDDKFHTNKLERHLAIHGQYPELEASASRARYISQTGEPFAEDGYLASHYEGMKEVYFRSNSIFASLLVANHLVTTSSLFIKRDAFIEIGGFLPLRYVHDWFMFLTLAMRGRFFIIEEDLVDYRRHPANTIIENDARGRVEDNFVLEWQLFRALSSEPPIMEPGEAVQCLEQNKRVSWQLMVLFEQWRHCNRNDLGKAAAIFEQPDHPLIRYALDVVRRDRPGWSLKRLVNRCLGQRSLTLADYVARSRGLVGRLLRTFSGHGLFP